MNQPEVPADKDRKEQKAESEAPSNVTPIGAATNTKTKRKVDSKQGAKGKSHARELGEVKPIAAAPRREPPALGEPGDLPPRPGAFDEIVREIYDRIADDPTKWVPVLPAEAEDENVQTLQTSMTSAARRLGRPIRTAIRVEGGKQVLWVRPL